MRAHPTLWGCASQSCVRQWGAWGCASGGPPAASRWAGQQSSAALSLRPGWCAGKGAFFARARARVPLGPYLPPPPLHTPPPTLPLPPHFFFHFCRALGLPPLPREQRTLPTSLEVSVCAALVEWALSAVANVSASLGTPPCASSLLSSPSPEAAVRQAAEDAARSGGVGTPMLANLLRKGHKLPGRPGVSVGMVGLVGGAGGPGGGAGSALGGGAVALTKESVGKAPTWKPMNAFSFTV